MDLHHVHIFATDLPRTLDWWCRNLGARVLFDGTNAGVRNVLIAIGIGRINIYDQPPRDRGRNGVHHLGVRVRGLEAEWARLQLDGMTSPGGLRRHDGLAYVMVEAPDGILVELFEFDDPGSPYNIDG